jgi:hypothetical protein
MLYSNRTQESRDEDDLGQAEPQLQREHHNHESLVLLASPQFKDHHATYSACNCEEGDWDAAENDEEGVLAFSH